MLTSFPSSLDNAYQFYTITNLEIYPNLDMKTYTNTNKAEKAVNFDSIQRFDLKDMLNIQLPSD